MAYVIDIILYCSTLQTMFFKYYIDSFGALQKNLDGS